MRLIRSAKALRHPKPMPRKTDAAQNRRRAKPAPRKTGATQRPDQHSFQVAG
jgi:hypothetical protein